MLMQNALWLAIAAGVVAVLYGVFMARWILAQPAGSERVSRRPKRSYPRRSAPPRRPIR